MTTTEINIETMLPWSGTKRVETSRGSKMLRKATATPEFWGMWRSDKEALKEAGISVTKKGGDQWEVCWWLPVSAEVAEAEKEAVAASRATDAAVEIPRPAGLDYLGFQKAGIAFGRQALLAGKRGVLIADEMGLGKTIQAIGLMNASETMKKVLVVCPASLKLNWERELRKWLTRPLTIGVQDSTDAYLGNAVDVLIVNYDIVLKFRADLLAAEWDLMVLDEVHFIKNPKAQRTKAILGAGRRNTETHEPPIPARFIAAMTGTPICNRPKELWTVIHSLDPEIWSNFFVFGKRYCNATNNGFGWNFDGASNLDELQRKLRSSIMVRRLKKDVLTELPPKRRQVIEVPAEGNARELVAKEIAKAKEWEVKMAEFKARMELAKVNDDAEEYAEAVSALRAGQKASFEEGGKIAHEIALAKVPYTINYLKQLVEDGQKVIVFAHHLDVIAKLEEAFPKSVKVTGEVSTEDRQAAVDRFQRDPECNPFIGGIHAAGVGLTLTAANLVVFHELDWVPGNMSQCEDRAHRIGQTDSVLVQHLVLEGSLDAHIARVLIAKQEVIDSALDRIHAERPVETGSVRTTVMLKITDEPVTPTTDKAEITLRQREIEEESILLTKEQIEAIHRCMQHIAGMCDGAQKIDGCGFNKMDAHIGRSLAYNVGLTPKQAVLGQRLVRKYQRQLSENAVIAAGVIPMTKRNCNRPAIC